MTQALCIPWRFYSKIGTEGPKYSYKTKIPSGNQPHTSLLTHAVEIRSAMLIEGNTDLSPYEARGNREYQGAWNMGKAEGGQSAASRLSQKAKNISGDRLETFS